MTEEWKPIGGYEGYYEVSDEGRVRSMTRVLSDGRTRQGSLLRGHPDRDGYVRVRLSKNGVVRNLVVHRLVCEAFHGPAPEGREWAIHGPLGVGVNTPDNVIWGSPVQNAADRKRDGTDRSARTKCIRGHPFNEVNTYVTPEGRRKCRTCHRDRATKYYRRSRFND